MKQTDDRPILLGEASVVAGALRRVLAAFDAELQADVGCVNRLIERVRCYRGKLLRPRLLLLSGAACGKLGSEHIVLGAVVEMVHMATLVHDDVLDEADVRRCRRTVNRVAGNEAAVLLGDYLISHAYHLSSSLGSTYASRRIAATTNTVCEGELLQIDQRGNLDLSETDYLEIIRRKTAVLTGLCCELGAHFAGADRETVDRLRQFGAELGLAFQIIDDVLDLTGTSSEIGKTTGRDADLGKVTLPIIRFLQTASSTHRQRLRSVLAAPESTGGESADGAAISDRSRRIQMLLDGSDAITYASDVARSYVHSAIAHLCTLPPNDARDELIAAAEFVLRRRH